MTLSLVRSSDTDPTRCISKTNGTITNTPSLPAKNANEVIGHKPVAKHSLFIATSPIPASWNSTNDGEHNSLTPIITKSFFPSSVPFSATNSKKALRRFFLIIEYLGGIKKTKKMKKSDILFAYVIFLL